MTDKLDLSIIVSSYNREEKIEQTLKSLFESDLTSFEAIELLIIDDGSPRPVRRVIERIGKPPDTINLRLIEQTNAGIGATRNRGFSEARSDLLLFLDDDIILEPKTLQAVLDSSLLCAGPIFFGSYPFVSHSSPSIERFAATLFGYDSITDETKFDRVDAITSGLLFVNRGELVETSAFYRDDLSTPAAEEYEIIARMNRQQIPIYHAKHISAIHNHHLDFEWLTQQQYKYGLATAEAFAKAPEIVGLKTFADLRANLNFSNGSDAKNFLKRVLASRLGLKTLQVAIRACENIFPNGNHDRLFGLAVAAYFRSGYSEGVGRFGTR